MDQRIYDRAGSSLQGGPDQEKGSGVGGLPKAVQEQVRSDDRRRVTISYGPGRTRDRCERDMKLLRWCLLPAAYPMVIKQKEKEEKDKDEKNRIPEGELETLPELLVQTINFHILKKKGDLDGQQLEGPGNAKSHHTDKYSCCKGKDAQPVLRRGQEFKVTITFNRPFNPEQDNLIFIVEADEDSTDKALSARFTMDIKRDDPWTEGEDWAARLLKDKAEENGLHLAVYIPGSCVVGEWELKVVTALKDQARDCVYTHPQTLTVLFNPWSAQDQVHYTGDKCDLREYVLNDQGAVFHGGDTNYIKPKPWDYGQFKEDILQISLSVLRQAFDFRMTANMGNPVIVARVVSAMVNFSEIKGVLLGNWSGNYLDGTDPYNWDSSTDILKQYAEDGLPVKYGQCWVFSHVLTTVCRTLGLPCRSVTKDVHELKAADINTSWNFHMWNEVWMQRPDIVGRDCHGWQVVDATPQGLPYVGPCPVKAVKHGWIDVPFEVPFVFEQVHSDLKHWLDHVVRTQEDTQSALEDDWEGNGNGSNPDLTKPRVLKLILRTVDSQEQRVDLTDTYRYPPFSDEARQVFHDRIYLQHRIDSDMATMVRCLAAPASCGQTQPGTASTPMAANIAQSTPSATSGSENFGGMNKRFLATKNDKATPSAKVGSGNLEGMRQRFLLDGSKASGGSGNQHIRTVPEKNRTDNGTAGSGSQTDSIKPQTQDTNSDLKKDEEQKTMETAEAYCRMKPMLRALFFCYCFLFVSEYFRLSYL